jgi:hypothetical protein
VSRSDLRRGRRARAGCSRPDPVVPVAGSGSPSGCRSERVRIRSPVPDLRRGRRAREDGRRVRRRRRMAGRREDGRRACRTAAQPILVGRRGLGRRHPSVPAHRARHAEGLCRHGWGLVDGSVQARRGLGRAEAMGAAMREKGGDGEDFGGPGFGVPRGSGGGTRGIFFGAAGHLFFGSVRPS